VSFPTFEELFKAIDDGAADRILAPLENSLIGSVQRCYELLLKSSLHIVAEIVLPVSHFLIACEAATIDSITTVESHPAALAQCERFFSAHPGIERVASADTAGSVRRAVESNDPTRAAIGGARAAAIYGGTILRSHIEDHSENFTRFALLAPEPDDDQRGEKVSLVLRLAHRPGSLHDALRPFVRRGIDLLKIESRPIVGTPGEFDFYLDVRAPAVEGELRGALDDVGAEAVSVRFLGRYSTLRVSAED
jgi:prephenate dehydratase